MISPQTHKCNTSQPAQSLTLFQCRAVFSLKACLCFNKERPNCLCKSTQRSVLWVTHRANMQSGFALTGWSNFCWEAGSKHKRKNVKVVQVVCCFFYTCWYKYKRNRHLNVSERPPCTLAYVRPGEACFSIEPCDRLPNCPGCTRLLPSVSWDTLKRTTTLNRIHRCRSLMDGLHILESFLLYQKENKKYLMSSGPFLGITSSLITALENSQQAFMSVYLKHYSGMKV